MKKHALTLAVSLAVPVVAVAGEPAPYDDYTRAADGTINLNTPCPATMVTCGGNPIADTDFLQREMTDAGGTTYFQTIISSVDATTGETFSTESFVKTGASNGGIAAKQALSASDATDGTLNSSTTLAIGSFNDTVEDQVVLGQTITDAPTGATFQAGFDFNKKADNTTVTTLTQDVVVIGAAGSTDDFSDSFKYIQNKDTAGTVTGTSLDIVSGVMLNDSPNQDIQDQTFSFASRTGSFTTAGNADLLSDPTNTPVVSWVAGETIERVLVGQNVVDAGQFGYDRITNVTTPADSTVFDLASTGPFNDPTNGASNPFAAGSNITLITTPLP